MTNPRFLLTLGLIFMLMGIALPYLMIIHVLTSTFFLNFLTWGISVTGLALGTVGFGMSVRLRKDD
jgi:hypothetical protein